MNVHFSINKSLSLVSGRVQIFGTTLTDQNYIHEEIKMKLNLGNSCYHSIQCLLSSHLLSRNVKVKVYKTIILPLVLYGYEARSLTLMEENRLRVFEDRVLRRIFGPKRDEVTGEWRKLHSKEFHNLYSSPDIIRQVKSSQMRWTGHVACMGEERKVFKVLVGKPKGDRPLGRPRHRWTGTEWILGRLVWGVWIGFD
jgi:hypothetical protein